MASCVILLIGHNISQTPIPQLAAASLREAPYWEPVGLLWWQQISCLALQPAHELQDRVAWKLCMQLWSGDFSTPQLLFLWALSPEPVIVHWTFKPWAGSWELEMESSPAATSMCMEERWKAPWSLAHSLGSFEAPWAPRTRDPGASTQCLIWALGEGSKSQLQVYF